jgi:hypothetical protein
LKIACAPAELKTLVYDARSRWIWERISVVRSGDGAHQNAPVNNKRVLTRFFYSALSNSTILKKPRIKHQTSLRIYSTPPCSPVDKSSICTRERERACIRKSHRPVHYLLYKVFLQYRYKIVQHNTRMTKDEETPLKLEVQAHSRNPRYPPNTAVLTTMAMALSSSPAQNSGAVATGLQG